MANAASLGIKGLLFLIVAFGLSVWTTRSDALFSMHHRVIDSAGRADGQRLVSLHIEITNHSTADLEALRLVPVNQPLWTTAGGQARLTLPALESGETVAVNWQVIAPSKGHWRGSQAMMFTGSARQKQGKSISLTVSSQPESQPNMP